MIWSPESSTNANPDNSITIIFPISEQGSKLRSFFNNVPILLVSKCTISNHYNKEEIPGIEKKNHQ